ncbi:hypothetical protein DL93DRAFT_2168560 [Clavulina sp. PMI_390]|nr:hypothetical protein DL93DRAFT_2168560 [Clavulina sp. PMI_390]
MPELTPENASEGPLTLPNLRSLVIEALEYHLLLSIIYLLDAPQIEHLGIGITQIREDNEGHQLDLLTPESACRELAQCINRFECLTSLTLRAYVPIQRQLVELLGYGIMQNGRISEQTAPMLLRLSFPHLNPFQDLSSSRHRLWKLGKALEKALKERQRDGSHVTKLRTIAVPRCLYEMRKKNLRSASGARILEMDCQCTFDDEWLERREVDIDPESGWNWDSIFRSPQSASDYDPGFSDDEDEGDYPANHESSFRFRGSDDSDWDYYSVDSYSEAEDKPEDCPNSVADSEDDADS